MSWPRSSSRCSSGPSSSGTASRNSRSGSGSARPRSRSRSTRSGSRRPGSDMMDSRSPFAAILRAAVANTPGAIGGSFAASDGETVDYVSDWERTEWEIVTAHFGVVMHHVQAALHTFHFGEAELVIVCHRDLDIVIHSVTEGYYAMLALSRPRSLARAMVSLSRASAMLRQEMA